MGSLMLFLPSTYYTLTLTKELRCTCVAPIIPQPAQLRTLATHVHGTATS